MLVRKGDKVFACPAPTERTRTPAEICDMIDAQKIKADHIEVENVISAVEAAEKEAGENDIILVCGSLYILGEAISLLNRQEADA